MNKKSVVRFLRFAFSLSEAETSVNSSVVSRCISHYTNRREFHTKYIFFTHFRQLSATKNSYFCLYISKKNILYFVYYNFYYGKEESLAYGLKGATIWSIWGKRPRASDSGNVVAISYCLCLQYLLVINNKLKNLLLVKNIR